METGETIMSNLILGMLAETFIHSGIGRNEGAIDLPAAREAATDYPYIPGSSLKGALRDYARSHWKNGDSNKVDTCFGKEGAEQAGGILVSDARLLLLPVRSLSGAYKWATCPLLLERLDRDLQRAGAGKVLPTITKPADGRYIGKNDGALHLEERVFSHDGELPDGLTDVLGRFIAHEGTRKRLGDQLLILSDGDFNWFARYALSVQARNVLDDDKKSKNLWYEESLPPDTLLYALLGERTSDSGMDDLNTLLSDHPYLQTGGNETVGMGWLAITRFTGENAEEAEQ
jgi:CRISPR-associated protein Cmr4